MKTQKENKPQRFTRVMNLQVELSRLSRERLFGMLIGMAKIDPGMINALPLDTPKAHLVRLVLVGRLGRKLMEDYDQAVIENYTKLFNADPKRLDAMINAYYSLIGEGRPASETAGSDQ